MDWFHNLQVRTKLVLSFSILMLLLITLTVTSYSSIRTMAQLVVNMHANQLLPIKDIATSNVYAVYENRALYRYIGELDSDLREQALTNMGKFEQQMWDFLASYRKTNLTQHEIDLLSRFDQAWTLYKGYQNDILKVIQTQSVDVDADRKAYRMMFAGITRNTGYCHPSALSIIWNRDNWRWTFSMRFYMPLAVASIA